MIERQFRMRSAFAVALCVAFVILDACGGATEVTGSAGGAPGAGSGGSGTSSTATAATTGTITTGSVMTVGAGGSTGVGGAANGGSAGTSGGGGAGQDAGMCPAAEPTVGSPCAAPGRLNCFYGTNPCCGGAYTCSADGKWATLGLGCACLPPPKDGGTDARANDASSDASLDCGGATCAADQFCVHPSTNPCGPAPECLPMTDAGACPPGSMFNSFCRGSASGGCVATPMRGPPHCATVTNKCGASASMCSCLMGNPCDPNGADICQQVQGRDVYCVCVAP